MMMLFYQDAVTAHDDSTERQRGTFVGWMASKDTLGIKFYVEAALAFKDVTASPKVYSSSHNHFTELTTPSHAPPPPTATYLCDIMKVHVYRKYKNGISCEEAMDFYKNHVFGAGKFSSVAKWDTAPKREMMENPEKDRNKIMHMGLPLTKMFDLYGCDGIAMKKKSKENIGCGSHVEIEEKKLEKESHDDCQDDDGDNHKNKENSRDSDYSLWIEAESKEQADKYFAALSGDGGSISMPMCNMFWGGYYGMCTDAFGIHWMISSPISTTRTATGAEIKDHEAPTATNKFGDDKLQINGQLNFRNGKCAAAFDFYKKIFGGEFTFKGTYGDAPPSAKAFSAKNKKLDNDKVMHVSLPLTKHFSLQGCDVIATVADNEENDTITKDWSGYAMSLMFATKNDATTTFALLRQGGGKVHMPLGDMFWGDYYGVVTDKFGNRWNVSYNAMNARLLSGDGSSTATPSVAAMTNPTTTTATSSPSVNKVEQKKMKVNIYREFQNGKCAEAFDFYKSVFGGEFTWKAEWSMAPENTIANVEQDGSKIMHMGLPLTEGLELMGCDEVAMKDNGTGGSSHLPTTVNLSNIDGGDDDDDSPRNTKRPKLNGTDATGAISMIPSSSMTHNVHIAISPQSKQHADQLMAALSADGGVVQMPMGDKFWGSYFGLCMDRFGTQWMFDYFDSPTAPTETENVCTAVVVGDEHKKD